MIAYLLNISLMSDVAILRLVAMHMAPAIVTALRLSLLRLLYLHRGLLVRDTEKLFVVSWAVPHIGLELGTAFVQGDRMSERSNHCVGCGERESVGNDSDRVDCVPVAYSLSISRDQRRAFAHQTPRNSMSTSIQKAFLKAFDWAHPASSGRAYILYAKGTCW